LPLPVEGITKNKIQWSLADARQQPTHHSFVWVTTAVLKFVFFYGLLGKGSRLFCGLPSVPCNNLLLA
jgi:hypothetical protein